MSEKAILERIKKNTFKEKVSLFNIENHILNALNTDGVYHKQWYLEEILKEIMLPEKYKKRLDRYDWEEGIAP